MTKIQKKYAGKAFRTAPAVSPQDYLDTAIQASRYLEQSMVEKEDGIYWETKAASSDSRTCLINRMGLYGGLAGILYFYLKLYQVTKEERYLAIVRKAVSYICNHLREAFPDKIRTLSEDQGQVSLDVGILGIGGIGFVLSEIYETFRWETVGEALHCIRDFYLEHCRHSKEGISWTGSTTMITDNGVVLFLLKYAQIFPGEPLDEVIRLEGEWFLSRQILLEDGTVRYAGLECVWPGIKPNFEVGTAGSGYVLAKLYEFTKEKKYLEAAEKCAAFLDHCKIPQGNGSLIPFRLDGGKDDVCYLGTCSGPAGTCRFFYLLYRLTGKKAYLDEIYDLTEGMEALGAPKVQSPGLWYNLNLCCGHAGILQFFLGLYHAEGEEHFLELAVQTASVILGEKEELTDGAARWHIALERIRPDVTTVPLGYYLGVAGIAASLLQLYLTQTHHFHWKRFIDDPFPEK